MSCCGRRAVVDARTADALKIRMKFYFCGSLSVPILIFSTILPFHWNKTILLDAGVPVWRVPGFRSRSLLMRYFPVFLDLEGRAVLVVGGGEQALQKVRLVRRSPARITVVADEVGPELIALGVEGRIRIERRTFDVADVEGMALVYAATGSAAGNAPVIAAARAHGIPVNAVDEPEHSSFITPAIVDRDPVVVAIGTEGAAPVIAREIKSRLEAILPTRFGRLAQAARALRERAARDIPDGVLRRRFWERLLAGPFRDAALAGDASMVESAAEAAFGAVECTPKGRISLIGCGPGDADLLTLKAQQRLQEADVLVIDRLVGEDVLDYARRDAERIHVGKMPGGPSAGQDEINRILVCQGLKGRRVARLKGGDPMIFGRAAEEMAAAQAAGIEVEVIPGVTAAHACAARIGLPVTLREKVRAFTVLTGATADGELAHDWRALARPGAAFAIYMGVGSAGEMQRRLLSAGADSETPVVIVENGTRHDEVAVATVLGATSDAIRAHGLKGPAIIFVGLDWGDAGLERPGHVKHYPPLPRWSSVQVAEATHWVMG
jgi:uroporphyrin-III C-methyltransferase/precorrin-2 dehydrogenase/sirohydrochlorin ferrochelatase